MIDQNLENKNYNYQESKSEIIQFNEYSNEQTLGQP